jgi:gliding motility-associated protein GldC
MSIQASVNLHQHKQAPMPNEKVSRTSEITVKVHLGEDNVPVHMEWTASDAQFKGFKPCNSAMLGFWDTEDQNALRLDLWTKEMRIDEMDKFFYQTFLVMADSYLRATGNSKGANDMKAFATAFGKNSGVLKATL